MALDQLANSYQTTPIQAFLDLKFRGIMFPCSIGSARLYHNTCIATYVLLSTAAGAGHGGVKILGVWVGGDGANYHVTAFFIISVFFVLHIRHPYDL